MGAHSPRMQCPACSSDTAVAGHCSHCWSRLPVAAAGLVPCSRCNHLILRQAGWCPSCLASDCHAPRVAVADRVSSPDEVQAFAARDTPAGGGLQFEEWRRGCAALGSSASPVLLSLLRKGSSAEQEAALICLRVHGFEAWAIGLPNITEYKVRAPDADVFDTVVAGQAHKECPRRAAEQPDAADGAGKSERRR
jgi:hypothetical protein